MLLDITAATELSDQPHLRSNTRFCLVVCVEIKKAKNTAQTTLKLMQNPNHWHEKPQDAKNAYPLLNWYAKVTSQAEKQTMLHTHSRVASLVKTEATKVTTLKVITTASKKLTSNQTCITKRLRISTCYLDSIEHRLGQYSRILRCLSEVDLRNWCMSFTPACPKPSVPTSCKTEMCSGNS